MGNLIFPKDVTSYLSGERNRGNQNGRLHKLDWTQSDMAEQFVFLFCRGCCRSSHFS